MKNKENGITLIALIITIIVMLILVGVTINVALNGGLFDTASDAKVKTQKEADREQLLAAVIGTLDNDGKVYFGEEGGTTGLDNNLPDDFEGSNGTYTNTKTGKQYTVNSTTGEVKEKQVIAIDYDKRYNVTINDLGNIDFIKLFDWNANYYGYAFPFLPEGETLEHAVQIENYSQLLITIDNGKAVILYEDFANNKTYEYDMENNKWEGDSSPLSTLTVQNVYLVSDSAIRYFSQNQFNGLTDDQIAEIATLTPVN